MKILIDGQTLCTPELNRGIGVYTKNVINNLVKMSIEHEWYIAISDEKKIKELDPWVSTRVKVLVDEACRPGTDYDRNGRYTLFLDKCVQKHHIDVLWISNFLMVNVLALEEMPKCRLIITVYDLIPYIYPVKEWPDRVREEYQRRIDFFKANDSVELIYISEATKQDFHNMVSEEHKNIVTFLAADEMKFYRKQEVSKFNHMILFTGGFDYRKNIDGALEVYKNALERYAEDGEFQNSCLYIVGKCDEELLKKYINKTNNMGIGKKVIFTGYVDDERLAQLYQSADVFFFPSKYEGFGLPILEAMLGGDYIVAADNSSLPEVCGNRAILFDVNDIDSAVESLHQGYNIAKIEDIQKKNERQDYARQFTWKKTARKTLDFITQYDVVGNTKKKTIAIVTPWPTQKTGIANYEYMLLPYLLKYYNVEVFSDVEEVKPITKRGVAFFPIAELENRKYDYAIYELGNNSEFHKSIYNANKHFGGIAEMHDLTLTPFFWHAFYLEGELENFKQALIDGYGDKLGNELYEKAHSKHQQPDESRYTMSESICKIADKVIVHNMWSKQRLKDYKNVGVIPHPAFEKKYNWTTKEVQKFREQYAENDIPILGSFGWVNKNKRPEVILKSLQKLKDKKIEFRYVFWGENNVEGLENMICDMGIGDDVIIAGYMDEETYSKAMEATDIVVNLRYPSMGETSGTLCESFKASRAVIVSDLNQYQEYPDEVCWKLPVGQGEVELLTEYLEFLISHVEVREQLGKNALDYANSVLNPERIAKLYYQFLEK